MSQESLIKNIPDDALYKVIMDSDRVMWKFIGTKLLFVELKLKLSKADDTETRALCCSSLRAMFSKHASIPSVQKDIQLLVDQANKKQ